MESGLIGAMDAPSLGPAGKLIPSRVKLWKLCHIWTSPVPFSYRQLENIVEGCPTSINALCYGSFKQDQIVLNNHGLSQGVRTFMKGCRLIGCHSGIAGMTIAPLIGVLNIQYQIMKSNLQSSVLVVGSFINHTRSISDHLEDLVPPVKVLSVYDVDEALSFLEKEPVNLLIIDACLRGNSDGFDLCHTIRSSSQLRHLPVILLLARSLSLERSKGILAGADLLMQRPVVKEEICKMVELLLEWNSHRDDTTATTGARVQPLRRLRSVT